MQRLKKFHRSILKNEGAGDNFLGLTVEKLQILKSNFTAISLVLANFAAFLDHTKKNADVSKNDGQS